MKHAREQNALTDRIGPPHQRVIRHLVTRADSGSQHLWLGTTSIDPGFSSNPHAHAAQEEVFYCVAGRGRIRVDVEEMPMEPGIAVYVPPGCVHQLINDGDQVLKVVAAVSPPFDPGGFRRDHLITE